MLDELFIFTDRFARVNLRYVITGSIASNLYGALRMTNDVDIVMEISDNSIPELIHEFDTDQFYIPPAEVISLECARSTNGHFNILNTLSGYKADVYTRCDDPLHRRILNQPNIVEVQGRKLPLAPVEYLIARKFQYFLEGGNTKHIQDIRAILKSAGTTLDPVTLKDFLNSLKIATDFHGHFPDLSIS